MKVLIVGDPKTGAMGGREHALAVAASKDPDVDTIFVSTENSGVLQTPKVECLEPRIGLEELLVMAKCAGVALVIPGPESAYDAGIVDIGKSQGLAVFGPTKAAAKIETSKWF